VERSQAQIALAWLAAELDLVEAMPDSAEKTAAIKALAALPDLAVRFTGIRRAEVLRLRHVEQLSLGKTAASVGISKARVDQQERDERRKKAAGNGQPHDDQE
jgi:predicted DNA-binding protein (UPF0251 family)